MVPSWLFLCLLYEIKNKKKFHLRIKHLVVEKRQHRRMQHRGVETGEINLFYHQDYLVHILAGEQSCL